MSLIFSLEFLFLLPLIGAACLLEGTREARVFWLMKNKLLNPYFIPQLDERSWLEEYITMYSMALDLSTPSR